MTDDDRPDPSAVLDQFRQLIHPIDGTVLQKIADVFAEVLGERARQIELHGWTPEHDDRHGRQEWAWLLARRVNELQCPFDEAVLDPRRALVEIAAITVAAIESFDRTAVVTDVGTDDFGNGAQP